MNSGQREEMWNSPQHAKAMVALDLKNGLGDTPRKEEGRKFVAVPVWVLWLTGAIILGLVMAVMSLSVVALHNRQTLINWENNDDYPAEKGVHRRNVRETEFNVRKKRMVDMHMTIDDGLEMEERLEKKIETHHLSAHLVPSDGYGIIYTVHELSPIIWVNELHHHHSHNDLFHSNGTGYLGVKKPGYYSLSLTVMFNGRDATSRSIAPPICTLRVMLSRHENDEHSLLMASVTQDEGGRRILSVPADRYPFDSTHVGGIYKLHQEDRITVKPDHWSPGCRISMQGSKTHFDAYYLRPIPE